MLFKILFFSKYYYVWKVSENPYVFKASSHFSNFGIMIFFKTRIHPSDVFPNVNPPEIIDIADVSDVARFRVRVSPKFRAHLGRRPIRETRLIGISCATWSRRFYVFRARNIPTASPLFSHFATHLEGIPRVAPATRLYSRSFSVPARKITSQPDITRWRSVFRAISFIPNAWISWKCSRLNIS